jgi:hypothetical protein
VAVVRLIGITFFVLAAFVAVESVRALAANATMPSMMFQPTADQARSSPRRNSTPLSQHGVIVSAPAIDRVPRVFQSELPA